MGSEMCIRDSRKFNPLTRFFNHATVEGKGNNLSPDQIQGSQTLEQGRPFETDRHRASGPSCPPGAAHERHRGRILDIRGSHAPPTPPIRPHEARLRASRARGRHRPPRIRSLRSPAALQGTCAQSGDLVGTPGGRPALHARRKRKKRPALLDGLLTLNLVG